MPLGIITLTIIVTGLASGVSCLDDDGESDMEDDDQQLRLLEFDGADDVTCQTCGSTLWLDTAPVLAGDATQSEGRDVEPTSTNQVRLICQKCSQTKFVRRRRLRKRLPTSEPLPDARHVVKTAIELSNTRSLRDFKGH